MLEFGLRFAFDVWVFTALILTWSQIVGGRDGRLFVARALILVQVYLLRATWEQSRWYGPRVFQWVVTQIARELHALIRVVRRGLPGHVHQVSPSAERHT
ncbi:MAG: hypothetical protein A3E37_01980 [Candidatus Andersenbacteria bacterium RIFCSPHIGHO2_12_FULL_46_9]|nr:MAG: hypothetical protein UW94_C0015G0019 [Parcubacteria group bacterium GW2011_GWA2_45_14]OGY33900.1 MAG: hypothetical protein A3B76_01485 [Candidatus Andersenbacteria bacterium RIFCSPHIGHO2_02_FULL_46_16]OGY36031.1 MAG: hypothetical protein A3I08_02885 [Candidatus Andersenbacteria bacterium RIFCSPLOWO2_02_FULL_46_11]OGY36802.1 MAG: hypothetical protein A3E37_01980 [Candidatus Andersenbacteria bacterium RIFCSPHIGHO2_12_FULL_46_9]HBE89981.1 hypothetical protein [Candidatus Andersenbacteria b